MKYALYEDPKTHKFAFLAVPNRFAEGDLLPGVLADRWFKTHAEALAALPGLLNLDEADPFGDVNAPPPPGWPEVH